MNAVWNSYGQLCGCPEIFKKSCKFFCRELDIRVPKNVDPVLQEIRSDLEKGIQEDLKKALALLKNTRRLHDELESCYIPCMNFAEIEKIQRKLIAEINEM